MVIQDWKSAATYAVLETHSGAQWAWQFLRRNPCYQAEWRVFDETWRALESAYGRPPNRDFCAWKLDPRAWVAAMDCAQADCRVDGDKVLIECALGARWGFYKFPPDPRIEDAVGEGLLTWREVPRETVVLNTGKFDWLEGAPSRVAIGIDLAWPLREQIEQAKRTLQRLQRQRRLAGELEMVSARRLAGPFVSMVRLLDAVAADARPDQLGRIEADWQPLLDEAMALRDDGYRGLAALPD